MWRPAAIFAAALLACDARTEPIPTTPPSTTDPIGSPGDHVKFFVIGKSWHYDQDESGEVALRDLGYFAEIFKTAGGEATNASMRLQQPGAEPIPFVREADNGAVLHARAGKRHKDLGALDAELPNGDYGFSFSTPAGDVSDYAVTLAAPNGNTDLPPPPNITLTQGGSPVASTKVAPGVDVRVSWSPFATGRADPNGVADDLIFVMMSDCHGDRAFHSGRPLGTPNPLAPDQESERVLTYAATEITIPGSAFEPGLRLVLDVEHARLLDTDTRDGVVGMATFAVTTHLAIQVTGDPGNRACPGPGQVPTS